MYLRDFWDCETHIHTIPKPTLNETWKPRSFFFLFLPVLLLFHYWHSMLQCIIHTLPVRTSIPVQQNATRATYCLFFRSVFVPNFCQSVSSCQHPKEVIFNLVLYEVVQLGATKHLFFPLRDINSFFFLLSDCLSDEIVSDSTIPVM